MFLFLARIVFQPFLVFPPAKSQFKGTVGFIKLDMGKGRWYGIRGLIWKSNISPSTDYAAALEFYTANKSTMWEEGDQKEVAGKNDREQ